MKRFVTTERNFVLGALSLTAIYCVALIVWLFFKPLSNINYEVNLVATRIFQAVVLSMFCLCCYLIRKGIKKKDKAMQTE